MAEPEELISDAARHATEFAQSLWRRHHPAAADTRLYLREFAPRLALLLQALFDRDFPIRTAKLPARATLLAIVFQRHPAPRREQAVAATDGHALWLPPIAPFDNRTDAVHWYRTLALQQAMRAQRGSASVLLNQLTPLQRSLYLLLEAQACDVLLCEKLPGSLESLQRLRRQSLQQRPALSQFHGVRRVLEQGIRNLLACAPNNAAEHLPLTQSPQDSLQQLQAVLKHWKLNEPDPSYRKAGLFPLLQDHWTGDLINQHKSTQSVSWEEDNDEPEQKNQTQSTQLPRAPDVRPAAENEDEHSSESSPWMIQLDEPHRAAEDPMGLQRPTDRDEDTAAEDFADMVSELDQARLVRTPQQAKEFLLSDAPPSSTAPPMAHQTQQDGKGIHYPEWDYRTQCYRDPGARLFMLPAAQGSEQWVNDTLQKHQVQIREIRRHFEMLQARRQWQRRQWDGDDVDLDAYTDSLADFRAGQPMSQRLYQSRRAVHRDMAICLLIDVSGSTDSWVSQNRRVIDVAREALLLVCIALDSLGEPWLAQAFSGEGPQAVTVRALKSFSEPWSRDIALRISSLEPEHYTRAGAAIRHASASLMQQPAQHRLLLMLSDGKPNDKDEYEGRYGAEDTRQAVSEARLQGIQPFCLTIDRQAANYLPQIFGKHHYALLQDPERLPRVLLDWMKRLIVQ
ncbi:MAG TPA: hypothetical protein VM553_03950 [Dongiaceae bacterium]|nr:hypothetical protein [Dongiaceae bacterium]